MGHHNDKTLFDWLLCKPYLILKIYHLFLTKVTAPARIFLLAVSRTFSCLPKAINDKKVEICRRVYVQKYQKHSNFPGDFFVDQ